MSRVGSAASLILHRQWMRMCAIAGGSALWALASVTAWGWGSAQAECAGPGALGGDDDCAFT